MTDEGKYCWRALLVIVAGGFAKAFVQGLLAAALVFMAVTPGVGSGYLAVFAGLGAASQIISSLVSAFLAERFGLRRVIVASGVLLFGSAVLFFVTSGGISWMVANVTKGLFFGVAAAVLPVLMTATVSSDHIGRASGMFQLSQQVGGVSGALAGAAVAALGGDAPAKALRTDFILMAVPALAFLLLSVGMRDAVVPGCGQTPRKRGEIRWTACGSAVLFMVFMSACGVGTILEYSVLLLARHGFDAAAASGMSVLVSVLCIAAVALSASLAVRMRESTRVRIGAVGMAVGLTGAALAHGWPFAVAVALAAVSFSFGPGTCAWGLVPRLITPRYRTRGTAMAIVAGQLVSLLLTTAFLPVMDRLGLGFWLVCFGIISAIMALGASVLEKKVLQA